MKLRSAASCFPVNEIAFIADRVRRSHNRQRSFMLEAAGCGDNPLPTIHTRYRTMIDLSLRGSSFREERQPRSAAVSAGEVDEGTFEQLHKTVERFVRERLMPAEKEVEECDTVPPAIIDEMKAMGMFGISIPQEYGGLGLSLSHEVQLIHEMGRTSLAFRSVFGTNVGIGSQGIAMDGTKEQKAEWLPRLASGEAVASFALTEPGAGSDAGSVKTRAERSGSGFIVNGTKRYITNAPMATVFTLMARTDASRAGADGVTAFVVPADSPGISLGKIDKKMGQRGTRTCDVIFDNVKVSEQNIIGGPARENLGFKTAMKVLDKGRIHIAALALGSARRLIEEATAYALDRVQFGRPIAEFQLIQAMLANSYTDYHAGRCMLLEATAEHDRHGAAPMHASCVKYFCSEAVGRIADRAVQILGGAGYMSEYAVERIYRDVRLLRIYEGTSEIQQLIIAKNLLKAFKDG